MEYDVLKEVGAKLKLIKKLVLEYHVFSDLPQNLGKILNILDENGFTYLIAEVPSVRMPIPFKLNNSYKYFNLIYAENKSFEG